MPVDGPLALEIVVAGKRFGGFDASTDSYEIGVPAGASPRITAVRIQRGARYRILEQADGVPGTAVVQVHGRSFFGPIVKNYVFEISSR